jgi:hypothetical protein
MEEQSAPVMDISLINTGRMRRKTTPNPMFSIKHTG